LNRFPFLNSIPKHLARQ